VLGAPGLGLRGPAAVDCGAWLGCAAYPGDVAARASILAALAGAVRVVLTAAFARELGLAIWLSTGRRPERYAPGVVRHRSSVRHEPAGARFLDGLRVCHPADDQNRKFELWLAFGAIAGLGLQNNIRWRFLPLGCSLVCCFHRIVNCCSPRGSLPGVAWRS